MNGPFMCNIKQFIKTIHSCSEGKYKFNLYAIKIDL